MEVSVLFHDGLTSRTVHVNIHFLKIRASEKKKNKIKDGVFTFLGGSLTDYIQILLFKHTGEECVKYETMTVLCESMNTSPCILVDSKSAYRCFKRQQMFPLRTQGDVFMLIVLS